jgi:hypothetical protein
LHPWAMCAKSASWWSSFAFVRAAQLNATWYLSKSLLSACTRDHLKSIPIRSNHETAADLALHLLHTANVKDGHWITWWPCIHQLLSRASTWYFWNWNLVIIIWLYSFAWQGTESAWCSAWKPLHVWIIWNCRVTFCGFGFFFCFDSGA